MIITALILLFFFGSPVAAQEVFRCASGDAVGSDTCTAETYLLEVLHRDGVGAAMQSLDALARSDETIRRDAHSYAHAIGLAAYDGTEDVGQVFARCTPAYQSGCYHGVIQSYFGQQVEQHLGGINPGLVNGLCRGLRDDPDSQWLLFQCAHGMGHGLMMVENRELPAALGGCDLVEDSWERQACYGGVFMENIVDVTAPHHAVGRPEMHDHGGGHEMAGGGHGAHVAPTASMVMNDFPPLDRDDPLYPCDALPARYSTACYEMQTSAILYFNGQDVPAAARTCATAPEEFRTTCFQSLGRDVSAITGQDHARAMRLCASAPDEYEPWCHLGYTKNLIDITANPEDGLAYCRLLPVGESKRVCYVAVGEQVRVLAAAAERRASICSAAEAAYVDDCRHGAGLAQTTGADPAPRARSR